MSWLTFRVKGKRPSAVAAALPDTLGAATEANAQDLLATARRAVHKITHRTEESLDVIMEDALHGHLVGRYGAVFEVARGGDHDFSTQALDAVRPRAQARVQQALKEAGQ